MLTLSFQKDNNILYHPVSSILNLGHDVVGEIVQFVSHIARCVKNDTRRQCSVKLKTGVLYYPAYYCKIIGHCVKSCMDIIN